MDEKLLEALRAAYLANEALSRRIDVIMENSDDDDFDWDKADSARFDVWEEAHDVLDRLLAASLDTESSASRQHFIDTGHFLFRGEAVES